MALSPPPIRGKAAATPPVDAIQDRFSAPHCLAALSPALHSFFLFLNTVFLTSQGVFLRSFKVHFSDSVSMPSNTSFESLLPGSPLSSSPHSSFSKLYFSDISLSKCISLILQSVFLRLPKLQPETICRVPAASISPAALFLTGPSCFSRC